MNEAHPPSKFATWKRPLISGFLSALIAEAAVIALVATDFHYIDIHPAIAGFCVLFATPAIVAARAMNIESNVTYFVFSFIFWFLAGAVIGRFIKRNIYAIAGWFLLYIVIGFIAFSLCLFCM